MEFFPTVLRGIFHPRSLMKFIFFSSIEQSSRHVEMLTFLTFGLWLPPMIGGLFTRKGTKKTLAIVDSPVG